jgi:hypothetical protein
MSGDVTYKLPFRIDLRRGDSNVHANLMPTFVYNSVASVTFETASGGSAKINIIQLRDTHDIITIPNVLTGAPAVQGQTETVVIPACPDFQVRRAWIVSERWLTSHPDQMIGIRDLRDVSMIQAGSRDAAIVKDNLEQVVGSPTNAFGSRPVGVSPPSNCPNMWCTSLIYFVSDCNAYSFGLNTLNFALLQPVDVQVRLMGGTLESPVPWPGEAYGMTDLDMIHDFYHYPVQWDRTEAYPPQVVSVGKDISGATPDKVPVSINLQTRRDDNLYDGRVHFECGYLRDPTSATVEGNLLVLFSTDPTWSLTQETLNDAFRNPHLQHDGILAVACAMQLSLRSSFTLEIDVKGHTELPFHMKPVDARGLEAMEPDGSPSQTVVNWFDLQNIATYLPRQTGTVRLAPAAAAIKGVDVFGISVYWLRQLLRSVGVKLEFPVRALFPTLSEPGSPNANTFNALSHTASLDMGRLARNLLQAIEPAPSTNGTEANTGKPSLVIGLPYDPTNTHWEYIQTVDLQNPSSKTKAETALTMSLTLGLMLLLGGLALIKMPKKLELSRMF